jgi:hypothetical protein
MYKIGCQAITMHTLRIINMNVINFNNINNKKKFKKKSSAAAAGRLELQSVFGWTPLLELLAGAEKRATVQSPKLLSRSYKLNMIINSTIPKT